MPLVWTTASTSVTIAAFNQATAIGGHLTSAANQYTLNGNVYATSNLALTYQGTATSAVNGWSQHQADDFYRQLQLIGYAQNQAAYNQPPPQPRRTNEEHVRSRGRARKLLMSALSHSQQATYSLHGYFDVAVGGTVYRIHQGTHGNVRELGGDGREKYLWCAQPDHVPAEDAMLAQMLLLRHDEAAFRRVANRRPI